MEALGEEVGIFGGGAWIGGGAREVVGGSGEFSKSLGADDSGLRGIGGVGGAAGWFDGSVGVGGAGCGGGAG